MHPLLVVLRVF